jgi:tRNA(Arg) A34 adenosine deaminase TadA
MTQFDEIDKQMMETACRLAEENVNRGGGPFGAVIVDANREIVATGVNEVTRNNDPTAHAEVNAIRNACSKVANFKLEGCVVYSSCEPCPMCLSALYWAGVKRIIFGNTKADADAIDFSDQFIYDEIALHPEERSIPCLHMTTQRAIRAFQMWAEKTDKIVY